MKKKLSRRDFLTYFFSTICGIGASYLYYSQKIKKIIPITSVIDDFPNVYLPLIMNQKYISIYERIKLEATKLINEASYPLPLIGSWNASTWWNYNISTAGYSPDWQIQMIEEGHHFLPWFNIPEPDFTCPNPQDCIYISYLETPIKKAASYNLPISFIGTEWEHYLYDSSEYFNLPINLNPNVITTNGIILKKLSPFAPVNSWYDVGKKWGSSEIMQRIVNWYPSPPMILFASNNEASKLRWLEVETDKHYIDLYGYGRDDNFKRRVISEGWEERYSQLILGFKDGLGNPVWKENSRFVGYSAFGPGFFGRWWGWKEYTLYIPNQIDPNPLFWDGGSSSLYIKPTIGERDNNVIGLLFQAMNWEFIKKEANLINPKFWYEISSWDEDKIGRDKYIELGESFTPERYGGAIQFAMWVLRPRLIREFRQYSQSRPEIINWFVPIINAVDRIYSNQVLESFWRNSKLVVNPIQQHPYQYDIPTEYQTAERMFLLNTSIDPIQPWTLETKLQVMCLARVKGTSPNRQWLIYGYAPSGTRRNVSITLPEYGQIILDILVEGSFYSVDESNNQISPITDSV